VLQDKGSEDTMTQEAFNKMFAVAMTDHNRSLAAGPVSGWAADDWQWAVNHGLLDGTVSRSPLTREMAAAVMARFQRLSADK